MTFYDPRGKMLHEVPMDNGWLSTVGINSEYLFYYNFSEKNEGEIVVWTLRLADLGKPDIEGEVFYEYVLGENG